MTIRLTTADEVTVVAKMFPGPEVVDAPGFSYLLAHGFTGNSDRAEVLAIAGWLNERGASVLVPDLRGHGRSGGLSTVGADEIHDVAACLDWLRRERPSDQVVTLGFSMGASVVVRHAGLGGSPDAVVAVSGPGRWYERGTAPMRRVHFGVETRLGRLVLRHGYKTRVAVRDGWRTLPLAPVEAAQHLDCPLLVVHGDSDPYFGIEHGRMLATAAPKSEFWLESGMGHAESAMTPDLVARIDNWARLAIGASATIAP